MTVRGLNTAATLWGSAAVGTLAGTGLLAAALIATATILIINVALRPLVRLIDERVKLTGNVETSYRFHVVCADEQAAVVRSICLRHVHSQSGMLIRGISTEEQAGSTKASVRVDIFSTVRNDKYLNDLVARLSAEPSVTSASWKRWRKDRRAAGFVRAVG